MAIALNGNWFRGKAFDIHTTSSSYLGVNEFGHDSFENVKTPMGALIHALKYRGDVSAVPAIISLLDGIRGIETFDFIIPIPPTNKNRKVQPVEAIAVALGERRGVGVLTGLLTNSGHEELKGITDPLERDELLQSALQFSGGHDIAGKNILLVDDVYDSGSTLRIATDLVYKKGKASSVSVLTMTKTRSNR